MDTLSEYRSQRAACRELFAKKTRDYGTSWRILRPSSLTDQLYIKAKRIRSIEEKGGEQRVGDSIQSEYIGLVNYSLIALIQLHTAADTDLELSTEVVLEQYDHWAQQTEELMQAKNHDYGEAWRDMRLSSLTDLILVKLLRLRQIEAHGGKMLASEGAAANYQDIINYALFALIKMTNAE